MRLARSVLFTPGTRGDRIGKAIQARAADIVVADLEDGVAPEAKDAARETVGRVLAEHAGDDAPLRAVRVNTLASGMAILDLAAVMPARPRLIVVPKAERVADVAAVDVALARFEALHGFPRGGTRLLLIVESARGVVNVSRLARASPRVMGLAFGAEDLAADAGLKRSRENTEVLAARSAVALAAAAARVAAIDQVFVDIDDEDGLMEETRAACALGYVGKMVIHPKQIPVVHEAFKPDADEVARARRLLDAAAAGGAEAGGVLRFEGRMIDVPLIEQARRVVAQHDAARRGA